MNFKNDCLMKNLFKVLFVAVATTVLFACTKETESDPGIIRTVEFAAGPVSKTVFGTPADGKVPTLWTVNKTVGISLNLATPKQSTTPEVFDGGESATFKADITDSGSSPYTFYAVSPYSSVLGVNSNYQSILVDIPASQTPLAASVDENAQILYAKYEAGDSFPTTLVAMDFAHLTAYGKISFSNLALDSGETISSVSLTAAENWAGRYYYYVSEDNLEANSAGKTITLTTSSDTDIWFACAPVDLGGKQVKVVIATNLGNTYTKRITIPVGEKYLFKSGKVNAFTINMNGIEPDGPVQYELVTNPADLTVGSQVIIAAPGTTASAMSTTQNSNNRGETSVTKAQEGAFITSPGDAVQILTVEAGNIANTIAFSTGEGYLYAASSGSNYLRTEGTLSDNSSWTVSITNEGEATLTAQGVNTRNVIRYNGGNNPPIYSCYASSSSTGSLVSLYMLAYDWVLDNIAVTTAPDKTTYEAGEDFAPAGMVVTAHYVDADDSEHTKDVVIANSDLTFDPETDLQAGTTSVTISYGGKETTQDITVTAPKVWDLQSIAVSTEPDKTTYTEGEYFDPTGLVVTATFEERGNTSNTKNVDVDNNDLVFTPSTSTALTTSDESVTIRYTVSEVTKTTTQAITVNAESPVVYYEKVTSAPSNWAGDYLIVYEASSTSGEVLTGVSSNLGQHSTVVISDSKILASEYEQYNVQIERSGESYTMKLGSKYLAYTSTATSGSNYLYAVADASTNGTLWTLSVDDARNVYNTSRYLRYNTGSPRFCCYTSGQQKIAFYKLNDNTVWDLKSIAVTAAPTKITYEAGEFFDPTGMVVTATYEDHAGVKADKTETIAHNDLTFTPALNVALTTETTSVTISYEGKETTQAITVSAAKVWDLKSIAVKTAPTKTTYTEGDFFDPAGLVITPTFENRNNTAETKTGDDVVYSNETSASFAFSPTTSTALLTTDTSVGISYTASGITKSTTQAITVNGADAPVTGEIYHENFGTPSGNTALANFTGWEKGGLLVQSSVTYSYSGSTATPIRATSPSSGYTGASGNGCLYTAAGGCLTVEGINVTGANYITFSCGTQATSANTTVTYKFNTQASSSSLAATTSKTTGPGTWGLVSYAKLEVPDGATSVTLSITIGSASRIDDLRLEATEN